MCLISYLNYSWFNVYIMPFSQEYFEFNSCLLHFNRYFNYFVQRSGLIRIIFIYESFLSLLRLSGKISYSFQFQHLGTIRKRRQHVNKFLTPFDYFLDSRAEIHQIFASVFWKLKPPKSNMRLTFTWKTVFSSVEYIAR